MALKKMPSGYGMVQTCIMRSKISIHAKAFYALLASYTGAKNVCFPSIAQMSEDMNISKKMVVKYINELVGSGLLIKSKLNNNPWNHNNKYELYLMEDETQVNSDVSPQVNNENYPQVNNENYPQVNNENYPQVNNEVTPQVKSNSIINNNNISNNNIIVSSETKEPTLYSQVLNSFTAHNKTGFDFAREGKAIKDIIKRTKEDATLIKDIITKYYELTTSSAPFWASQPFIPSVLNSGGIWPRVYKELKKGEAIDSTIDEAERLRVERDKRILGEYYGQ